MSKRFNPELIDFEYDMMPVENMEWTTLTAEQNEDINKTLRAAFDSNYPMALRFYKILTKGNTVKLDKGHMVKLNKDYINRVMESGTIE